MTEQSTRPGGGPGDKEIRSFVDSSFYCGFFPFSQKRLKTIYPSRIKMSTMPPPPQEFSKHTRACLRCKLVKTFDQFLTDGCENCETLNLKNNTELVSQWTTNAYSGVISLIDPKASWTSKWLRLGQSKPGCYALGTHSLKSAKI